jgi:hypothetical protein
MLQNITAHMNKHLVKNYHKDNIDYVIENV